MNMPHPFDFPQTSPDARLLQRFTKGDRSVIRHDLVFRAVDQERGCGVSAETEGGERGDGGYEVGRRRRGPGFAVGGTDAIEEEGEAAPFFEEGEN